MPLDSSRDPKCVIEVSYKGMPPKRSKETYKQGPKLWDRIMEGYEYYVRKEGL